MTDSRRESMLSISVADAELLIEASRDSLLWICEELQRQIMESHPLDPIATEDIAHWAAQAAGITRIAVELLGEIASRPA